LLEEEVKYKAIKVMRYKGEHMIAERLSMLGNLTKTFISHKDDVVFKFFNESKRISKTSEIKYSKSTLEKYNETVGWEKEGIHPCFPYALLTHMQFSIVTDKRFPFSPFGIIHKAEKIECLKELKPGTWKMTSVVPVIRKVPNGYELELISTLFIDGELSWRSTTTAFKRTKKGLTKFSREVADLEKSKLINIPKNLGRKYASVSNNFDLIHISDFTAKMMGQKKAIIHGMWTVARGISEMDTVSIPSQMEFKFLTPIYMNSNTQFQKSEAGFKFFNETGKRIHLDATISY
jgi:hypothetical protein